MQGSIAVLQCGHERGLNMFSICKTVFATAAAVLAATMLTVRPSDPAESGEQLAGLLTAIPAEQQIQLAMSAAPSEISRHATILVLAPNGYVTARTGTNGFTCLVERQYLETL